MKLLLAVFITLTLSNADEVQRIQDIVKHMSQLKLSYTKCQGELNKYKRLLEEEKDKNTKLLAQIDNNGTSQTKIEDEKPNNKLEEVLKVKENETKGLKNQIIDKKTEKSVSKIKRFEASAFRLKEDSDIFNAIDGKKVDSWEKGTSFTSYKKTDGWIKITGHFVNRKWERVKKEMWVKSDNVFKRD